MSFIKYFEKDGPPKLKYRTVKVETTRLKVELHFVGKDQEMEVYTEHYTGTSENSDKNYILFNLATSILRDTHVYLHANNIIIDQRYYSFSKLIVKDEKKVEIEIDEPYYQD